MDGSGTLIENRGAQVATMPSNDGLKFEHAFAGTVRGWGLFEDRFRRVRQRFTATMTGVHEADAFVLHEDLVYEDGRIQQRRWHVTRTSAGLYAARADDIIGKAEGRPIAGGVAWRYSMKVPVGRRTVALDFDDRLYFRDGGGILNLSEARKWGILAGRLIAVFSKA